MTGDDTTSFRSQKPVGGLANVSFGLATVLCRIDVATAQGCHLLDKTAWVALQALRPVFLLTDWRAVLSYLIEDASLLRHLLQIGESLCHLFRVVAG